MNNQKKICYLCGIEIQEVDEANNDHVVSSLFFEKEQPKQLGRDYYGKLEVHKDCNELWGGNKAKMEDVVLKALKLLHVKNNVPKGEYKGKKIVLFEKKDILFLDNEDRKFFGFIDMRKKDYSEISSGKVFNENKPSNQFEKAGDIAISVLCKNAAAILIRKNLVFEKHFWRILVVPIFDPDKSIKNDLNLRKIGKELEYSYEVKTYGNYVFIFSYLSTTVVIGFTDFMDYSIINDFESLFKKNNYPIYFFEGSKLNDLIGYKWIQNIFRIK
ncbi:MAG TPA: hypothetical protein PKE39_01680 [Ignavibacteria bacterium]|nr:hypothetical protein [Ignavibacteria bacterium]HMQ97709.1 hypothetical protein [Ignavibacteria bacterium]